LLLLPAVVGGVARLACDVARGLLHRLAHLPRHLAQRLSAALRRDAAAGHVLPHPAIGLVGGGADIGELLVR
jgi:hypothetical protein